MTENEAKEMLQAKLTCMQLDDLACIEKGCSRNCDDCEYNYAQGTRGEQEQAIKIAISIFKEIRQYRALGTVEELREVVGKQRAKKPHPYIAFDGIERNGCLNCFENNGRNEILYAGQKYCSECGQRIDWSQDSE